MTRHLLTSIFLLIINYAFGGDIIVSEGGSIHDALRQAREWRRTNDPRCKGGITITLQEGRYYMSEPLFLRPEDSGTKESPLVIRGIGEKHTSVICGDPRQKHRQIWPLKTSIPPTGPSPFLLHPPLCFEILSRRKPHSKWWFTSDGPSPFCVSRK